MKKKIKNSRLIKALGVGLLGTVVVPSLANAGRPPIRLGKNLTEGLGITRSSEGTLTGINVERVARAVPVIEGGAKVEILTGKVNNVIKEATVKNLNKPKITEVTQVKPADVKYYPMANKAANRGSEVLEEAVAGTKLTPQLRKDINGLLDETSLCKETRKDILRQAAEKGASIEDVKGMIEDAEMEFTESIAVLFDSYKVEKEAINYLMAADKYKLSVAQVEELIQSVRKLNLTPNQIVTRAEVMFGRKEYYALANTAERIPTLTVEIPQIAEKMYGLPPTVQQAYFNGIIEDMLSKAVRQERGVEIDWDKVFFSGSNQDKLIREYVDGLSDEMQEMFYHRVSLDKATQAKIVWAASEYNLGNFSDLLATADLTLQKFRGAVMDRPYYNLTDEAKKALSMVAAKYRPSIIELDDFAKAVSFSEIKTPEEILKLADEKFGAQLDKNVKYSDGKYVEEVDTDESPFFDDDGDILDDFF